MGNAYTVSFGTGTMSMLPAMSDTHPIGHHHFPHDPKHLCLQGRASVLQARTIVDLCPTGHTGLLSGLHIY